MEFTTLNYLNTTSMASVGSGSLSVDEMLLRNERRQYVSDSFDNDLTTAAMVIDFGETLPVSRLALLGMNLRGFNIYYDGVTANAFAMTSTGATTASQWTSNSETSMYLQFTTVSCQKVTIDMKTTQLADSEKAVGHLYLGDTKLVLPRTPSSKNYKPSMNPKQIVHKMSDGHIRIHTVDFKRSVGISFKYIDTSFRDSLYSIWREHAGFTFVAFPTTTGWDEMYFETVWPGPFGFFEYSQDTSEAGFSGKIKLEETEQ